MPLLCEGEGQREGVHLHMHLVLRAARCALRAAAAGLVRAGEGE
jgi:hypothetical protein